VSDVLVEAVGLVKRYPPRNRTSPAFTAVDGIDFVLRRGEAFGFLGPNGAGKSSTMRMIACVSPPTAGTLRVLGMDPGRDGRRIRARLGVVPQDDALDRELTVRENLLIYGRYFGLPKRLIAERGDRLLEFAQLTQRGDERVEALSGGMRRRLTIARSLINEPEILLLDEPTTGLDPQARHILWDRLFRLKQQGVSLVLTTHYMDEAEQLCDRLVVMDSGRIVAHGSPAELIAAHATREVLELRFGIGAQGVALEKLRDAGVHDRLEDLPDRLLWYTAEGEAALAVVHRLGLAPVTVQQGPGQRLGLVDTYLPLLIGKFLAGEAFFVFLMVQFIRNIPVELDESARIDGAGHWAIFWHIILPLSRPAMVTTAIFTFIWTWNDFLGPLIYISSPEKYPLPLALQLYIDQTTISDYWALMAMSMLALVPVVLFFLFFQRFLVQGVATSGLKG
jgi:lipooligosaccharide transport system ATP-binding protein